MEVIKGVPLLMLMMNGWVHGTPLCSLGDFDDQVQYLLANELVDSAEIQKILLMIPGLQETLRTRWDGADLFLYGSFSIGLASKTSDVDFYLQIPNYNVTADAYIVNETAKVLYNEPEKFSDIVLNLKKVVPMMTFYDLSIERPVDLSFRSRAAVEEMRLIAYYLSLDKRHLPLGAIVKLWCKVHKITGKGTLSNHVMYLLVVFYLQQKKMAPSVFETQANIPPRFVRKWNVNFAKLSYTVVNSETLHELLGGFFKFYADFNFEMYCISPHVGRPVPKSDFQNVDNLPKEFSWYKALVKAGEIKPMLLQAICVQDTFNHSANTARRANAEDVLKLINHLKLAAKKYDEVSSDRYLSSILTVDSDKEILQDGANIEVHKTLIFQDCLNDV